MGKSNVEIVLNHTGIVELLKSKEVEDMCLQRANAARSELGEGYEVTSMVGWDRCSAIVSAVSKKAKKENSDNNTILKALK